MFCEKSVPRFHLGQDVKGLDGVGSFHHVADQLLDVGISSLNVLQFPDSTHGSSHFPHIQRHFSFLPPVQNVRIFINHFPLQPHKCFFGTFRKLRKGQHQSPTHL